MAVVAPVYFCKYVSINSYGAFYQRKNVTSHQQFQTKSLTSLIFPPRPPGPNPTPSHAAAHRQELMPFAQLLPFDPIDHLPPRRHYLPSTTGNALLPPSLSCPSHDRQLSPHCCRRCASPCRPPHSMFNYSLMLEGSLCEAESVMKMKRPPTRPFSSPHSSSLFSALALSSLRTQVLQN